MAHITFLAMPSCSLSGIFSSIDAFSIANLYAAQGSDPNDEYSPLFTWDIVTLDGQPVEGEGRVMIQPHYSIHDIQKTDFIMIPGFLPPFDFRGRVPEEIKDWLCMWHKKNTLIGAVCTGTFLLAETGMLNGKTATTNWIYAKTFKKAYPQVKLKADRILTEDGGILCSGATSSFQDMCINLMERFGSVELAEICSKTLLMNKTRRSQSPFFVFSHQKDHSDESVLKAQEMMEQKYTEVISVDGLASGLGISTRHFIRRFKAATGDSPLLYLQRIRIEAAKAKLEKTRESIEEITLKIGYENANSFRKLFRKNTGLSPKEYRMQFSRLYSPDI